MEQQFSNSDIAGFLAQYLPDEIKDYFSKTYDELSCAYQEAIGSWLFSTDENVHVQDITLHKIIFFILDNELSNQTAEQAHAKILLQKKNRKAYLFRLIRQQAGELAMPASVKRNFIEEEWEAINNPYLRENEQLSFQLQSKEDFIASRLEQVTEWYKNENSYLFNFQYFHALSTDKKANDIIMEIQLSVISTICNDFYRNVQAVVTKTPDITFGTNAKIVNWQASTMNRIYEAKDNKITVYEDLGHDPENSIKIIIDEVPCDTSNSAIVEKLEMQLEKEYSEGTRIRTFDASDYNIYTATLNNMTLESANTKPIEISLSNMANDVYGASFRESTRKVRSKKYAELLSRLIKMSNMRISTSVQNSSGTLIGGSVISFFDLTYKIQSLGAEETTTILNVSDKTRIPDFSKLSIRDFESTVLTIMPSLFMKEQWRNVTHTVLESKAYHQITTQKGKVLLQMLQEDRLEKYPLLQSQIPFKRVKSRLRFSNYNDVTFKRELGNELKSLKEQGILISDYKMVRGNIQIEYKPLSDIEKMAFRV